MHTGIRAVYKRQRTPASRMFGSNSVSLKIVKALKVIMVFIVSSLALHDIYTQVGPNSDFMLKNRVEELQRENRRLETENGKLATRNMNLVIENGVCIKDK